MASDKLLLRSLDVNQIREKMKATHRTKLECNKKSGPMKRNDVGKRARIYHPYSSSYPWKSISEEIAKRYSEAQLHLSSNTDDVRESFQRQCITPTPSLSTPEVQIQMKRLHRRPVSPPVSQKRCYSLKRSFTRSRSPTSWSPSPLCRSPLLGSGDQLHVETVKKTIESLQTARLYLLRQNGQHVFTVASEGANKNSFKVTIGTQTCTCSSQQTPCIHLLFIMIRVLKVSENDQCIFNKTLKNFEVESLVENYEKRRKSRLSPNLKPKMSSDSTNQVIEDKMTSEVIKNVEVEDDLCTICTNPMKKEEMLTTCENGCKNKFHQHCMEIWSVACRKEKKSIECPLCRCVWVENKRFHFRSPKNPVHCQAISSSLPENHFQSSLSKNLSRASSVCTLFREKSSKANKTWIEIFGSQLITDLQSGDWSIRENKLKDVIDRAGMSMSQLVNNSNVAQSNVWGKLVTSFAGILQSMAMDPVYRVYLTSLEGLCTLVGNYVCLTEEDALRLQDLIRPIIRVVLTKCADGVSRTSQTSLDFISNLSGGQAGNIGVGKETLYPAQDDITGLVYILSCILEHERDDPDSSFTNWQRTLGRLYALDELMEVFPQEFYLVQVRANVQTPTSNKENRPNWSKNTQTPPKLLNHERITAVLGFALKFLKNPHVNIKKMAQRLYVRATRLATHVPKVFNHAYHMAAKVDPSLLSQLRDRTPSRDRSREDVELVSFSSVHFPDRRRSLGRCSLPTSPVGLRSPVNDHLGKFSPICNAVTARRASISSMTSMPTFARSFSVQEPPQSFSRQKPKRPNFLPLNNRLSLDPYCPPPKRNGNVNVGRRCSDGVIQGTDCCFNHICHVHASPCDRRCLAKRRKTTPTVPPNTPMCPVGDLIDLSVPCLLDAIPEVNSAKNMALNDPYMAPHKSLDVDPRLMLQSLSNFIMQRQRYMEGVDWIVDKVLGSGGFSRCVLGRDVDSGMYMAVKQVSYGSFNSVDIEKSRAIVRDEIKIMAKLDHPNIVQLLAAHERQEGYDLFVEWMPGGSVADNLYKFGSFSDWVIVKYLWQILCGLEYLHDNGILHRDLKGANLLIDSTGQQLRIADFGAAKRLISHTTLPGEFRGDVKGTTAFMAPEVLRGECYGRSCDVWSVGCCVIEMVTARPPWNVEEITNENALFYRIAASVEPPPIPEVMSELIKDFALRCLQPINTSRPSVKKLMTHMCFME